MSFATPADVRARWPAAPNDDTLIQAWIDDAATIIRAEYPWVDDWTGLDPELHSVLTVVVTRMVVRALSTPFGVRQEQVGDTALVYSDAQSLYLTDADRALIDGYGPQAAFTVTALPDRELPSDWRWWWARGFADEHEFWRWVR